MLFKKTCLYVVVKKVAQCCATKLADFVGNLYGTPYFVLDLSMLKCINNCTKTLF